MEPGGDMDPVLRSLDAELEREDPALAALLTGRRAHRRRHPSVWWLLALPLLLPALLLPARVVLGLLAMLLLLASPAFVFWLGAGADDPATGHT